jgi:hypothetical protein
MFVLDFMVKEDSLEYIVELKNITKIQYFLHKDMPIGIRVVDE